MNDEYFMKIALTEAYKSLKSDDVPVGAVIVINDKIISTGYNTKEKNHSVISHAEINALKKANKKLKSYRLDDAIIYITKEPCLMCMGALLSSRIKKIVYGASDLRFGTSHLAVENNFNHKCEIKSGVLSTECEALLSGFFKKLRGKNADTRKTKNNSKKTGEKG